MTRRHSWGERVVVRTVDYIEQPQDDKTTSLVLMLPPPPSSTQGVSPAASDVCKREAHERAHASRPAQVAGRTLLSSQWFILKHNQTHTRRPKQNCILRPHLLTSFNKGENRRSPDQVQLMNAHMPHAPRKWRGGRCSSRHGFY